MTDATGIPAEAGSAGGFARRLLARMPQITLDRIGAEALENARRHQALIARGRSLAELRNAPLGQGDSAVIVAAGPSIKRRDPLAALKSASYQGAVICTDSAILYCLRHGVVPDLVVTVDPHATRIVRWFGDPELETGTVQADDYFRRQDMDEAFAAELETNREIIRLLAEHAPRMHIALSTSASPAVVRRVTELGMQAYWFNPMFDDPDLPGSVTAALQDANGLPAVNCGGNVGTACWMMAHAVLGKTHVALTGMDFAYYAETPYRNTQYYTEALSIVGANDLDSFFVSAVNPHTNTRFYTDPAYLWYRECFLSLVQDADCATYNCTEGGLLFGKGIQFVPLARFLEQSA